MRIRHKVPSIFSLSMLDVLCCMMGCVILLWLLNAKQNDDETEEHKQETAALLARAASDRENSASLLSSARGEHQKLSARLRELLSDREKAAALKASLEDQIRALSDARGTLERQLSAQQARARSLEAKLKSASARVSSLEEDVHSTTARLEAEKKRSGDLGSRFATAEARLKEMRAGLEKARAGHRAELMRADSLMKTIEERKRELASLTRALNEARGAKRNLEKTLSGRDKELAAARLYKDRLDAAEERERFLEKQLRDRATAMAVARRALAALEKEKRTLAAAAESRFAGIALTGRRVIFLVDMSGSMEMVDENTAAPEKWVEVRNTVARLMRSLPGLEKFQVITFSTKAEFPLGSAGKWLEHHEKTSPELVLKTLAAVKPKGGTNMYAALEAAFRYRADGLDTVYLLSDGLPNLGEGLTAAQARNLNEIDRGTILGKYVRTKLTKEWNRRKADAPRVRINTIGFFYESPDLGAFLWALARENEGSFVGMSKP
jgi:hypothetical protein